MEKKVYATYDELSKVAKKAGIKSSRLEDAIDSHRLPETGQFNKEIEVLGGTKGELPHIRLSCTDGSICSVGRIRGMAHFGTPENATFVEGNQPHTKGFAFLRMETINTNLPADQARCAMLLSGKKFKTVKKSGFVIPFTRDDAGNPSFTKFTPANIEKLQEKMRKKDFWDIEILPD